MKTLVVMCLLLAAALGCKRPGEAPVAPASPVVVRESIDVLAPGGERTLRLEAETDGYTLVDGAGWSIGRAVIEERSVRVTDRGGETLVTVARSPTGFVLDDGSPGPPLLGRLTDEGLALTRGGELVAAFTRNVLNLGERTLFVVDNDAYVQVLEEGETILEVRGRVGQGAAYLGWQEQPFPARLALMLFAAESL